jgi:hypothetical protein
MAELEKGLRQKIKVLFDLIANGGLAMTTSRLLRTGLLVFHTGILRSCNAERIITFRSKISIQVLYTNENTSNVVRCDAFFSVQIAAKIP